MNATKSYLYFGRFARGAALCSNLFCFYCFWYLISLTKIELGYILDLVKLNLELCVLPFSKSTENSISLKCQLRPCCIHMLKCVAFTQSIHLPLKTWIWINVIVQHIKSNTPQHAQGNNAFLSQYSTFRCFHTHRWIAWHQTPIL